MLVISYPCSFARALGTKKKMVVTEQEKSMKPDNALVEARALDSKILRSNWAQLVAAGLAYPKPRPGSPFAAGCCRECEVQRFWHEIPIHLLSNT